MRSSSPLADGDMDGIVSAMQTTKLKTGESQIHGDDGELLNDAGERPDNHTKKEGFSFVLIFSAVSVTFGGSLLAGFNTAVLSVPSRHMKEFFNESHYQRSGDYLDENSERWLWSFTVSFLCIGAAVGALVSGYPSNKFGRKKTLMLNNAFSIVGASMMSLSFLAHSYEMVMIGRFVTGINLGVVTAVVPMYLTEISPTSLRGMVTVMHGMQQNFGVSLSQTLGLYVFTGESSWPWLIGPPVILISLFQLTTSLCCPESPRWLYIKKNQQQSAIKSLRRLRASNDISRDVSDMDEERAREKTQEVVGILDLLRLRQSDWGKPLLLTVVCNCCVHLTGVNAIWFYLVDVFRATGLTETQIGFVTVWLGLGNVIVNLLSGYCFDRFGRRPVIMGALGVCILNLCTLTVCMQFQTHYSWLPWISAALIACHTFMVSLGPGAAPFVICTEIWSQGPRSSAMAFGSQVYWTMNFLVGMLFPTLQDALGPYCFLLFAGSLGLILIYFWFELPETRNKTFEEIACGFTKKPTFENKDPLTRLHGDLPLQKS
ncbi:solute carrier family 2, facilitated glucose transporter member 5 [Strongylocentrotus purpuratus]|uniref:Major facilitator superfamily (MFS) profile domain-containing protein n=1 Tax=Strongylocentrotus purpuratus TaxID=7668 RepID=A0A7M7RHC8_STRPU|nr:solute carrier family 2, facilitated glucose transporter member 5 [Strongylocentrotus purpuratus]|eukprot:XP_795548.3 PREDICTED: solute carrier family 2, facilitated glucose transporter member 5 [Strongylocentrotus purpuratus]